MNDSPALNEQRPGSRTLCGGPVIHHRQRFFLSQGISPFECSATTLRDYAISAYGRGSRARGLAATDLAMQLVLRYQLGPGAIAWARPLADPDD